MESRGTGDRIPENGEPEFNVFQQLAKLRDTYSDEIPSRIIQSTDKDNRYKVRKGWWSSLIVTLSIGIEDNKFDDNNRTIANEFIEEYLNQPGKKRTSEEDIRRANNLINKMLKNG